MKKHLLFLMLFAGSILAFTSCKKDDDATLEGSWKLKTTKFYLYENDKLIDSQEISPEEGDPAFCFAFSGQQWVNYQGEVPPAFPADQTFVYSNGKLMFYSKGEQAEEVKVKTLNDRTLVISKEERDDSDGVTQRLETDFIFEKR